MADLIAVPDQIRVRLTPVAERALGSAARVAAGNGRNLVRPEDILISLLIDGGDEPEFAALLVRTGVDQTGLAREVLHLGRRQASPKEAEAKSRLAAFWTELGELEPEAPLDCARLLGVLLGPDHLAALTQQLLFEAGLSIEAALEAAWPVPKVAANQSRFGAPPFGLLLPDEAAHISLGRERLCRRLATQYRIGGSLLLYGPAGIGKHFLAVQSALAAGRPTVEVSGADLAGFSARERSLRLAELAAYIEAIEGGLLLADADDPRLTGSLRLSLGVPLLATARTSRLAVKISPARKLSRRQIPALERDALLRTLSAWQGGAIKPRLAADDVLVAVDLASSFMPEVAMPGAAINLIHIADLRRHQEKVTGPLDRDRLEETVSYLTRLPNALVSSEARERLRSLESRLGERIIGQRPAIAAVSRAIIRHEVSLGTSERPVGSFLFVGPSGVGKTELAKALAQVFYGTPSALVRFDMAEFQQDHEISKLIGAPPGYLGSNQDGQLIAALKKRRRVVLLFDEIDKAHPRVYDFLLGALDYGMVTGGMGTKVSLLEAVVIMTSNIGAGAKALGFGKVDQSAGERAASARAAAVVAHFASRPEFVNRLDGIIEFSALSRDELDAVLELRLRAYAFAYERAGLSIELGPALRAQMVTQAYGSGLGARELVTRRFNLEVEDRVADDLLAHGYTRGTTLRIELNEAGIPKLERHLPAAKAGHRAN